MLNNCWHEAGRASCQPCIKWSKTCGAPETRIFNANTQAFVGLPTPEPEQNGGAATDREPVAESSCCASARNMSSAIVAPSSSNGAPPSRPRGTTRQSAVTAPTPLQSDSEQALTTPEERSRSNSIQKVVKHSSRHKPKASTSSGRTTA